MHFALGGCPGRWEIHLSGQPSSKNTLTRYGNFCTMSAVIGFGKKEMLTLPLVEFYVCTFVHDAVCGVLNLCPQRHHQAGHETVRKSVFCGVQHFQL